LPLRWQASVKLLSAFLQGASPLDVAMFSAVTGVFVLTALAARLQPDLRAGVTNPLKCE
jgi:hypothetical protein